MYRHVKACHAGIKEREDIVCLISWDKRWWGARYAVTYIKKGTKNHEGKDAQKLGFSLKQAHWQPLQGALFGLGAPWPQKIITIWICPRPPGKRLEFNT